MKHAESIAAPIAHSGAGGAGSVRSIRRHAPRFAIRSTDGLYLEKSFLVIGACP
ncbi:MAG TPA: hypothetical protein VMS38_04515 [Pseudorhodoferax sp.]|nr:hypothetical protein [Pseudorhodoferax sp.]